MPLFLAGLLVRGGALAPEAAEEALQRQALFGGALDTSLLELGSIAEDELASYLSRASGLPAPPAGALDGPLDPSLRLLVAPKVAERHGVVPFAQEAGLVHVACTHPVEGTPVEELAPSAKGIVAHVAPEVRVRMAIERLYGIPAAMRLHDLERKLDGPAETPPADRGIESDPTGSVEEAFALLGSAADRDDALAVLLRFARQRFELAAALAVSGKTLVGWDALGPDPEAAARIKRLSLPVQEPSVLRLVLESGGPYLGPMGETDLARDLEAALGRRPPHVVLVLPIVVANRTVALLFAENGEHPIGPAHVEQVMHVAQAVGPALEKLIRARKNGTPPAAAGLSAFHAPSSVSAPTGVPVSVAAPPAASIPAPSHASAGTIGSASAPSRVASAPTGLPISPPSRAASAPTVAPIPAPSHAASAPTVAPIPAPSHAASAPMGSPIPAPSHAASAPVVAASALVPSPAVVVPASAGSSDTPSRTSGHPAPRASTAARSIAAPGPSAVSAPAPAATVAKETLAPASGEASPAEPAAATAFRLPARRRSRSVENPLEPARIAVERALATHTDAELEAVLPSLREVAGVAAQLLVSLLPADPVPAPPRAVQVLLSLGERSLPAIAAAAISPSKGIRLQAARLAAAFDVPQAAALLAALASDEDPDVAAAARHRSP